MLRTPHQSAFSPQLSCTSNIWLCSHPSSQAKSEQNSNFSSIRKEKGKFHLAHLSARYSSQPLRGMFQFKPQKQENQIPEPYYRNSEGCDNWKSLENLEVILQESGLFSSRLLHAILSNSDNQFSAVNLFTFRSTTLFPNNEWVKCYLFFFFSKRKTRSNWKVITEIRKW